MTNNKWMLTINVPLLPSFQMRSSVNSRLFMLRKKLDNLLFKLFPSTWVPLYTMVCWCISMCVCLCVCVCVFMCLHICVNMSLCVCMLPCYLVTLFQRRGFGREHSRISPPSASPTTTEECAC